MEHTLESTVLHVLRKRITEEFPNQVRACLQALRDEDVWWRPDDKSNSVGNLILHVCGSTRSYVLHAIGGADLTRDRPAEFAARETASRSELLEFFDRSFSEIAGALSAIAPNELMQSTERTGKKTTFVQILLHVAMHIYSHLGQIVFITKMKRPGEIEELWMKTNR